MPADTSPSSTSPLPHSPPPRQTLGTASCPSSEDWDAMFEATKDVATTEDDVTAVSDRYAHEYPAASYIPKTVLDRVITIIVGPSEKAFDVHKSLLVDNSDYFRVAFDGQWRETTEGVFKLTEENASVFALYVDYLYHHRVIYANTPDADAFFVEAYLLGDRRGSYKFKNAVMNALKILWGDERLPSTNAIMLAFSEETHSTHLRNLIVDKHAWEGKHEALLQQASKHNDNDIHPEFALAVYVAFLKRIRQPSQHAPSTKCHLRYDASIRCHTATHRLETRTACRGGCGWDYLETDVGISPVLTPSSEAPYKTRFCESYHEHAEGVKCQS